MSVYSGFATRAQETLYNENLSELVITLQNCIISLLKHEEERVQKLLSQYKRSVLTLKKLEQNKYLAPNFSVCCKNLSQFLKSISPKTPDPSVYILNGTVGYIEGRSPSRLEPSRSSKKILRTPVASRSSSRLKKAIPSEIYRHRALRQLFLK